MNNSPLPQNTVPVNTYPQATVATPVPVQPVATQPVSRPPSAEMEDPHVQQHSLRIYSHSMLLYWWPVWVVGYVMALLSYMRGDQIQIGAEQVWFHSSSNLGVFFFLTLFLVITITSFSIRGLASVIAILALALVAVLMAYLRVWDDVMAWMGNLRIYMNVGAYFWFSTLIFIVWFVSVFIVDRLSYWHIKPGQVTYEVLMGVGAKSYDTNGMSLEKHQEDVFRHFLLGMGSGDLQIRTSGATKEILEVPNVLFIGSKINRMERLIAEEPAH